ncbi:glucosaminidase domain-containing protein [Lacinutrix sp. C3R15]|uniref:glucosaminidase domain-containing protein n=1 Tax=Flavobacteriaceae TaxID=49546 RepID=UPI001C084520|nr:MULTISPECIES: glucosaminidase domain-containing protein [Flavobacteriaceae]MBU2939711.1 glucosaminidase domain-containing protein [Lacinutrix sp. C3R15]MDO6623026.1 glucosaminidase domain-containing protein [Oceanihabitans sp. 1_MG-2023]
MKKIIILSCLAVFMFSCGSSKKVTTKKNKTVIVDKRKEKKAEATEVVVTPEITQNTPEVYANATEEYIAIYSDIAQDEMRAYGIPASITLAQGILESASGKGRLSVEANNHFGIKCHDWTGARIYHDDDASQECFRKYNNSKYSFRDHSLFLTGRKRYSALFDFEQDDYESWAKGLRSAGYATDRKYPNKLISLIERYQLHRFDAEVLGKNATNNDKHTVIKGDTLYSISKKYKLTVKELQELNGLEDTGLFVGQVLFVKPMPKDY